MNRRALSVCAIVCPFEPNDSESRLFLGSAWVHRVLVSICLGMGIRIDVDDDGLPGYDPAKTDLEDKSRMLGYIPRAFNKPFARLMDAGKLLYGTVRHKELVAGYYKIVVKIFMRD